MRHDQRQKKPHSLTLSLNYTPVPLINFSYRYLIGEQRRREHLLTLSFTYRFRTPLSQQMDPQQVAVLHSLKGSYGEKVSRHNHIVLTYREAPTVITIDDADGFEWQKTIDELAESGTDSDDEQTESDAQAPKPVPALSKEQKLTLSETINAQLSQLHQHKKISKNANRRGAGKQAIRILKHLQKVKPRLYNKHFAKAEQESKAGKTYAEGPHTKKLFDEAFKLANKERRRKIQQFEESKNRLQQSEDWQKLQKLSQRMAVTLTRWSQ